MVKPSTRTLSQGPSPSPAGREPALSERSEPEGVWRKGSMMRGWVSTFDRSAETSRRAILSKTI